MGKYIPPFNGDPNDPDRSFVNADPANNVEGSIPDGQMYEIWQREGVNLIEKSGLTPSAENLNQLAQAVQSGRVVYVLASGTNALSGALDPAPTGTPPNGMHIIVWCPNANTGALTLSLNGGAAEPVLRRTGGNFLAGDIPAGGFFLLLARRPGAWRALAPVASEYAATAGDIITAYSPQQLAFDQYFSDENPTVQANLHYDTDGDADTMPGRAVKAYEYVYTSEFPSEKTLINVVMLSNLNVQRPGTDPVNAYIRGRATNAVGVKRNNYVSIDHMRRVVTQDWKSIATSMLVGKESGVTTNALQLHCWWSEDTPGIDGNPYRVFLDDCEMLIIERVVSELPSFPKAD